jgi:carboxyl-terminal processing protease
VTGERRQAFIAGAAIGILVGIVLAAALGIGNLTHNDSRADDAIDAVEQSYFRKVPESKLNDDSIQGMVTTLKKRYDDRFSHYFNPAQLRRFNESTSGSFSGVGLSVSEVKKGLRVATVFPNTPAKKAGIKPGDVITTVDGKSIAGVPSDVATSKIKGPSGTTVKLGVIPASGGKTKNYLLKRAQVQVPVVRGKIIDAGGNKAAYVQQAGFSEGVHAELQTTLERLYRKGAKGLILDLRGNGGGLLSEAVLCASVFVKKGETVVITKGRTQPHKVYKALGGSLKPRPTVVLINKDTASAAEILTSALKNHGLATVVGTRSFGKGVFQEVINLAAGGAVDITVGEYLTSTGHSLAGTGIKPQVQARDIPSTKPDEGLKKAKRVLARKLSQPG